MGKRIGFHGTCQPFYSKGLACPKKAGTGCDWAPSPQRDTHRGFMGDLPFMEVQRPLLYQVPREAAFSSRFQAQENVSSFTALKSKPRNVIQLPNNEPLPGATLLEWRSPKAQRGPARTSVATLKIAAGASSELAFALCSKAMLEFCRAGFWAECEIVVVELGRWVCKVQVVQSAVLVGLPCFTLAPFQIPCLVRASIDNNELDFLLKNLGIFLDVHRVRLRMPIYKPAFAASSATHSSCAPSSSILSAPTARSSFKVALHVLC